MCSSVYTLVPSDIGTFKTFGDKRGKAKGCAVRAEYNRWQKISGRASSNGVEMEKYHTVMYGYRCPLVRKVSVIGSVKL